MKTVAFYAIIIYCICHHHTVWHWHDDKYNDGLSLALHRESQLFISSTTYCDVVLPQTNLLSYYSLHAWESVNLALVYRALAVAHVELVF